MAESLARLKERTLVLIKKLKRAYPEAHCALIHENPLQLLVATILSAQCTDERVNRVTPKLFSRFPTAADYGSADLSEIEDIIRSLGFFRSKAKSLKGMGQKLTERHNGRVPADLEALTELPGVGRKTANVVLGNSFRLATGIVVDTHVKRLAYRLGLTSAKLPEKVEQDLLKLVPQQDWIDFSHWLIWHGRQICKARGPNCAECVLKEDCPRRGLKALH